MHSLIEGLKMACREFREVSMKALSLFSGIGGIDLACEWAGIETVAFCEREPFPQKVLRKHWPNVPIYDDVCTLTKERMEADGIGTIDIIHGGYPCQPFSNAGNRQGTEDDRHLWPEVFRLIQALNPRWFVGENVTGHITLGLDIVLADLESIGYSWEALVIPSSAVGAPHRRNRVFIVAYPKSVNQRGLPFGTKETFARLAFSSKDVAHATGERCGEEGEHRSKQSEEWATGGSWHKQGRTIESRMGRMLDGISDRLDEHRWPAYWGEEQHEWEPPRLATRVKNRHDRVKALGNAVNPYQIYPILAAIKQIDDMMRAG